MMIKNLEDVIAAMARVDEMTPDTITVGEFIVARYQDGDATEVRCCSYRENPQIVEEAKSVLRMAAILRELERTPD